MIIENTQRDMYTEGVGETKKMNIGAGVEAHIIKVLTENSYKQPLESSIRETASNALDSHLEAGVTDPITVKVYKDDVGMYHLEVKDVGLGLDTAGFEKYIMGLGESTKRNSEILLGGYGAGAKAPLSFVNSFTYICIKDGWERKFLIFKGRELPESTMIYEKVTDAHNGVTVNIPIGNSWNTLRDVTYAIKQQLAYFTGIYFDVQGIKNDFKVIRSEDWQISDMNNYQEMHLCLKDVYYPIEWSKLGINRINVPIGLRFDTYDGLQPVFNREELIYTEDTKEIILKKIKKVADWFVNKYNENVNTYESFIKAYPFINTSSKNVSFEGHSFMINDLLSHTDLKPNEPIVEGITLKSPEWYKSNKEHLLWEYHTVGLYNWNGVWKAKGFYYSDLTSEIVGKNSDKIILLKSAPIGNFKEFLKEKFDTHSRYIVKKNERKLGNSRSLQGYESYRYLFQLTTLPKNQWRDLIKEFQYVRDTILIEGVTDARNLETSKEYADWLLRKAEQRKADRVAGVGNYKTLNKQVGDITIAYARKGKTTDVIFEKNVFKIEDLHKNKQITVYFKEDEKDLAKKVFKALEKVNVKVALIGSKERNKLPTEWRWNKITRVKEEKIIHNFKTFHEFMKRDIKPFSRLVTSFKVNDVLDTYDNISSGEEIFKEIINKHYEDVKTLKAYNRSYYEDLDAGVKDAMIQIAEDNNLYDLEIMAIVNRVKKDIDLFDFVAILDTPNDRSWDEASKKLYKKVFYSMLLFKKKQYGAFEEYDIVPVPPVETLLSMHPEEEIELEDEFDTEGEAVEEDFELEEVD